MADSVERKILIGSIAIEDYVGRSWETILQWIETKNFPAARLTGRWESFPGNIDRWRLLQTCWNSKTGISYYTDRIVTNLRQRINIALRKNYQHGETITLLGCSIDNLKKYLENQFLPGMSWDNYGKAGWHIDHIIPCAVFDLSFPNQQKECFNYKNLQPMWAKENIRKGIKLDRPFQPSLPMIV